MKRLAVFVPVFLLAVLGLMVTQPVFGDKTLFYDSFQDQNLPQWNQWAPPAITHLGSFISGGGWLTMTTKDAVGGIEYIERFQGNVSDPVVPASVPDGQFFELAIRAQAFNITQLAPSSTQGSAQIDIGLADNFPNLNYPDHYLLFGLSESPSLGQNTGSQKTFIFLRVVKPSANPSKCFDSQTLGFPFTSCANPAIDYTNLNVPISLNAVHTYIIQMRLFPVAAKSWIAFSIDTMAVLNLTQTACSCIDDGSHSYVPMFPFLDLGTVNIAQYTTASFVNYVLAVDYPATSLPGSPSVSPVVPSTGPSPNIFGGGQTLPQYLQSQAALLGGGNVYMGGYMLTILFVVAFVVTEKRVGVGFGPVYAVTILGIVTIMYGLGLIQLYALAIPWIVVAASAFGVVPGFNVTKLGGDDNQVS